MQPHEILTKARALIEDPARWTQGDYYRTQNGVRCYCSLGALREIVGDYDSRLRAEEILYEGALKLANTGVVDINDGGTTIPGLTPHEAVLKMFDIAIEEARNAAR
jgi:hypothetical protein